MKPAMILKRVLRERDFSAGRSGEAIWTFSRKVAESVDLVNFVERKHPRRIRRLNARKNYVINIVTAAEVYFKDLIRILPSSQVVRRHSEGLSKLLADQITIWDAFQLLRTRKSRTPVKIGEILATTHLFENLQVIDSTFSTLLGCSFLKDVEDHRRKLNKTETEFFGVEELHLAVDLPDWRSQVSNLFEKRHEFVHQIRFDDDLTYDDISRFWWRLVCFAYAVNYFITDKYLIRSGKRAPRLQRHKRK